MAFPTLTPASVSSKSILSATGSLNDVVGALPLGIYAQVGTFITGASDQVAYTYKRLGGDVLDLELSDGEVYAAYEESVLEYSYILNVHQAKNILSNVLGGNTGTFDQDGNILSGDTLAGTNVNLKYPKFDFAYARRIGEGISAEVGIGGAETIYSASFKPQDDVQYYDLQNIISGSSVRGTDLGTGVSVPFASLVKNKKVLIKDVYYKTPTAMWRFFSYYGGVNVIGNLSTYGQWADDSTFQIVPVWQNKLQALAYEDAIYTRLSHFSFDIANNKLRLYPPPTSGSSPTKFWVRFTIPRDAWEEDSDKSTGINGINNMNTLPFENIPYGNINAIGKHWIRRYALALCKETLGWNRSKFATVPIPGESVTLNGPELIAQSKEERDTLRTELRETLDELTYGKLIEGDANLVEGAAKIHQSIPMAVFRG